LYRAKRLASSRPGMRVLFVSGYADQDTAELVLSEAKIGYLQKPFGPLDLARKVSEMISRRLPADRASRCRSETLRGNGHCITGKEELRENAKIGGRGGSEYRSNHVVREDPLLNPRDRALTVFSKGGADGFCPVRPTRSWAVSECLQGDARAL
jgi:hypothetical protein